MQETELCCICQCVISVTVSMPRGVYWEVEAGEGVISLRMCTLPVPILNTLCSVSKSPVVQCIVYANNIAGVDICCLEDYSICVHAHSIPAGFLLACGQCMLCHGMIYELGTWVRWGVE